MFRSTLTITAILGLAFVAPSAVADGGSDRTTKRFHEVCGLDTASLDFAAGSDAINKAGQRWLDAVAKCLRAGPMAGRSVVIAGYGDLPGRTEMGLRRAEAVRAALAERKVARDQMTAVSVRRSNDGVRRKGTGVPGGRATILRPVAPQYVPSTEGPQR